MGEEVSNATKDIDSPAALDHASIGDESAFVEEEDLNESGRLGAGWWDSYHHWHPGHYPGTHHHHHHHHHHHGGWPGLEGEAANAAGDVDSEQHLESAANIPYFDHLGQECWSACYGHSGKCPS